MSSSQAISLKVEHEPSVAEHQQKKILIVSQNENLSGPHGFVSFSFRTRRRHDSHVMDEWRHASHTITPRAVKISMIPLLEVFKTWGTLTKKNFDCATVRKSQVFTGFSVLVFGLDVDMTLMSWTSGDTLPIRSLPALCRRST